MGLPVTGDFAELIQTKCIFVINYLIPVSDVLSLDININAGTLDTPGGPATTPGHVECNGSFRKRTGHNKQKLHVV